MRRRALAPLLALGAGAALVLATKRNLQEPHFRLFNDMVYSPAARSQQASAVLPGGRVQQPPVAGTIPRGFKRFAYGSGAEERERAGRELKNPLALDLQTLAEGRRLFQDYCSHCHGPKGLGDGPTAAAFPSFSFPLASPAGLQSKDGALFHVITHGRNLMPAHAAQLPPEDRWKLIAYIRDLQHQELARLGPLATMPVDPRRNGPISAAYGRELFAQNCASCHGPQGLKPQPGIPTLHSAAVLAIADDEYYWDIITHGRPGTQMPAWSETLTPSQIKSVVAYIRSWATPPPERANILAQRGAQARGRALFATHCRACHGEQGQGGLGNSLNAPSFLAIASDAFLRDTIAMGRGHTAMPSSYDLKAGDVADLIAYIKSWRVQPPPFEEVSRRSPSKAAGAKVFAQRCAGCHGEEGEGGIGSRLNAESFLSMVDDRFLYRVITEGRPGAGMPAWRFLSADEIASVIAHIRGWQKGPSLALSTEPVEGRAEFGEVLFKAECQKCHMPAGSGDLGSQIGNSTFGSQVSDQFLFRSIAYGKQGTEMKGFLKRTRNPLPPQDIGHIVAFLRRLQKAPPLEPLKRSYSWASLDDGREVFEKKAGCAKCHGQHGEGATGPALGGVGFARVASADFVAASVVLGREKSPMPSFHRGGKVQLTDEEVENVSAYVVSLGQSPAGSRREVDRSPAAVRAGAAVFRAQCARCHGTAGEGRHGTHAGQFGPSLNNREFLKAADDNFLLATIALGRPGTPMPSFGAGTDTVKALTADDIRHVVAYLRSWEKAR